MLFKPHKADLVWLENIIIHTIPLKWDLWNKPTSRGVPPPFWWQPGTLLSPGGWGSGWGWFQASPPESPRWTRSLRPAGGCTRSRASSPAATASHQSSSAKGHSFVWEEGLYTAFNAAFSTSPGRADPAYAGMSLFSGRRVTGWARRSLAWRTDGGWWHLWNPTLALSCTDGGHNNSKHNNKDAWKVSAGI